MNIIVRCPNCQQIFTAHNSQGMYSAKLAIEKEYTCKKCEKDVKVSIDIKAELK